MNQYPTNLTDKQWQVTEKILDPQHRKRKYSLRDIMNAIMYMLKTGCQWRMLPKDFPPYNTVFYYFNKWKLEGVFEELMDTLHRMVRKLMGREETPSLGLIDSRSVKSSHHVDTDRGIDGNKKIKGRKEHIVVDTLGLPMSVVVHEANVHDSVGADDVIENMKGCFPRLKKMLADGGYKGQKLVDAVRQKLGAEFTVVLRPDESSKKFSVLPLRWIVERSFPGWKTFEELPWTTSFILIPAKRWFNLPSADSCITNCANEYGTLKKFRVGLSVGFTDHRQRFSPISVDGGPRDGPP